MTTALPASPRLRPSVSMFWHWRDVRKAHELERLMPNGEMTLVVNLAEDIVRIYDPHSLRLTGTTHGAVLVGAHAEPMAIDSEEQEHVFGIQFRPGGAAPFFREPVSEFRNLHVDLEDLWPGIRLRDRLLECRGDSSAMFAVAEAVLLCRLNAPLSRAVHPAVRHAALQLQQDPRGLTAAGLADSAGLSQRRFIQLFKEQTGLPPKLFARLCRFQRSIASIPAHFEPKWTDIAIECGYFDQSHLIRDFREFAGSSPGEYWRCANPQHLNHVAVL